jgi:hypothetical protein
MSSKKKRRKKVQNHGTIVFWSYGIWGPVSKGNAIKKLLPRGDVYSIPFPDDGNVPKAVLVAARELLLGGLISWKIAYNVDELVNMVEQGDHQSTSSGVIRVLPIAPVNRKNN